MESENRKLIKFSNYSLCITLPKTVIRKLKWEKGDVVRLVIDESKGEITVRKGLRVPKEKEIAKTISSTSDKKTGKARW